MPDKTPEISSYTGNSSMWFHIRKLMGKKRFILPMFFVSIVIMGQGTLSYVQGSWQFDIQEKVMDDDQSAVTDMFINLTIIIISQIIGRTLTRWILDNYVMLPLKKDFTLKLWTLMENADLDWLKHQDMMTIDNAIMEGVNAAVSVFIQAVMLTIPLLNSFTTVYVVVDEVGLIGLQTLISMIIILVIGFYFTRKDYIDRKDINKKVMPLKTHRRHLSKTMFSSIINSNTKEMVDKITDLTILESRLNIKQRNKRRWYYTFLEVLLNVLLLINVIFILKHTELKKTYPLWFSLTNAAWTMWGMFWQISNIIQIGSTWGALEKILTKYKCEVEREKGIMNKDSLLRHLPHNIPKDFRTVQLKGQSGSGKTTFMRKLVIDLFRKFEVDWMWMEQEIYIPEESIIGEYMMYFVDEKDRIKCIPYLFKWAKYLGLTMIKDEKLLEKFKGLSGGEKKRVVLLRYLLPILYSIHNLKMGKVGKSVPKYLFVDEPTAGLDKQTWFLVQQIFDHLKKNGINIFLIDHHDQVKADVILQVHKIEEEKVERKDEVYLELEEEGYIGSGRVNCCSGRMNCWQRIVESYEGKKEEDVHSEPPQVYVTVFNGEERESAIEIPGLPV